MINIFLIYGILFFEGLLIYWLGVVLNYRGDEIRELRKQVTDLSAAQGRTTQALRGMDELLEIHTQINAETKDVLARWIGEMNGREVEL